MWMAGQRKASSRKRKKAQSEHGKHILVQIGQKQFSNMILGSNFG
jgi:hypothetical protein